MAPSTVSETITRLERQLGVPILERTTRSLRLTDAGRALAERISPLFAETRAALDDAASSPTRARGRLKLNVPGAVMLDILPPLLDGFLELIGKSGSRSSSMTASSTWWPRTATRGSATANTLPKT